MHMYTRDVARCWLSWPGVQVAAGVHFLPHGEQLGATLLDKLTSLLTVISGEPSFAREEGMPAACNMACGAGTSFAAVGRQRLPPRKRFTQPSTSSSCNPPFELTLPSLVVLRAVLHCSRCTGVHLPVQVRRAGCARRLRARMQHFSIASPGALVHGNTSQVAPGSHVTPAMPPLPHSCSLLPIQKSLRNSSQCGMMRVLVVGLASCAVL